MPRACHHGCIRFDGADMEDEMSKPGKTMYATAIEDDLTDDGYGRIRILAEFNEPQTEVDMVTYPVDKDYDPANREIRASLDAAGYQVVGSTTDAIGGLIIPVARRLR